MQDQGRAELCAEMLRVGADRHQGLGDGLEQSVIDNTLVLERHTRQRRGQREHDMVIGDGKQVPPAGLQPVIGGRRLASRTMPVAAGVIGNVHRPAVLAAGDMPTEGNAGLFFSVSASFE